MAKVDIKAYDRFIQLGLYSLHIARL